MRIDYLHFNKLQPNHSGEKSTAADVQNTPPIVAGNRSDIASISAPEQVLPETPVQALERKEIATTESNRILAESAFSDFPELEELMIEEELSSSDQEKMVDRLELPRDAVERLKRAMEKTDLKTALKNALGRDENGTTAELLAKYAAKYQTTDLSTGSQETMRNLSAVAITPVFEHAVQTQTALEETLSAALEMAFSAPHDDSRPVSTVSPFAAQSKSYIEVEISYKNVELLSPYETQTDGIIEKEAMPAFIHSSHRAYPEDSSSQQIAESFVSVTMQKSNSLTANEQSILHLEDGSNRMEANHGSHEDISEASSHAESERVVRAETEENAAEWEQAVYHVLQQMLEGIDSQIEGLSIKNYVVERMTERTIHAAQEFREFQSTVSRVLDKITPDSVHRAIEALTKAINKSEFSLFTDMVTEKRLLLSLSELEKAKFALKARDFEMASQIVKRVRAGIEAIVFRPTSKKIHAFAAQMAQSTEHALKERKVSIREKISEGIRLYAQESTSREALQLARYMGANHEIEQLEQSVGISDIKNIRELLLKFSDENHALLMQSTGQQMMNDSDARERDFFMFTLPYEEDGKIEGMKVFLSGKSEDNQLDWQNADLYFSLKKGGERVGLKIRVVAGTVYIETSGFSPEFRGIQSELEQIGYRFGSIKRIDRHAENTLFQGLSERQETGIVKNENKDNRGIDVKI